MGLPGEIEAFRQGNRSPGSGDVVIGDGVRCAASAARRWSVVAAGAGQAEGQPTVAKRLRPPQGLVATTPSESITIRAGVVQ